MYLWAIVVFCLSFVHPFRCQAETGSTDDGILKYLQIDPNHVLEHEMVKVDLPGRLHKRDLPSGIPVNFQAFNGDINLFLQPVNSTFASDETPVFLASYAPGQGNGVHYERVHDAMKQVGHILEDPDVSASLVLGVDRSGRATINGYLRSRRDNSPMVIRSLPRRVAHEYLRNRRSIDDLGNDAVGSTYHLIAKLNESASHAGFMDGFHRAQAQRNRKSRSTANSTNQLPDTVYPQILVYVDYSLYQPFGSLENRIAPFLAYLLAFWNGVDMIYRQVDYPKFKLNLAGIIIAVHPNATSFIASSMVKNDTFDCEQAIKRLSFLSFGLRDELQLDSYDLVATMTHYKMGTNGTWHFNGWAYVGGVCVVDINKGRNNGAALIRDNFGFSGMTIAAHEIGHLFNLEHEDPFGPAECAPGLGFFMTNKTTATIHSSSFSQCSLDRIKGSFDAGLYDCMYNEPPITGKQLPRLMAGRLVSLHAQCRAHGWGKPVFVRNRTRDVCVEYFCADPTKPEGYWASGAIGAAPGTPCGPEDDAEPKICLKNRCVSL